jgi:predicted O-methyltransferase YrrM
MAKTKYSIHSPFVFDFVTNVLEQKKVKNEQLNNIEKLRKELSSSKKEIEVHDFGAGSDFKKTNTKKISEIVRNSTKSRKYANLLYRIITHYKTQNILELGTSAGLTSMYLSAPTCVNNLFTVEGCPETAKLAEDNFKKLNIKNIKQIIGNFDNVLPDILKQYPNFDFIFFDGNHTKEATLRYFGQCLSFISNESIFVFDDINWSKGMKDAWNSIKEHNVTSVTIDLFFIGIVFFRKELSKENFVIRY